MGMQKQERTKKWIASAFLELADQVLVHWIYHEEMNKPVLKLIREEKAYTEISVLALSRI